MRVQLSAALAACLILQACSSRPREFTPTLAAPAVSQAEFDTAYSECDTLLVEGKLDSEGRTASGAVGAAAGATTVAVGAVRVVAGLCQTFVRYPVAAPARQTVAVAADAEHFAFTDLAVDRELARRTGKLDTALGAVAHIAVAAVVIVAASLAHDDDPLLGAGVHALLALGRGGHHGQRDGELVGLDGVALSDGRVGDGRHAGVSARVLCSFGDGLVGHLVEVTRLVARCAQDEPSKLQCR